MSAGSKRVNYGGSEPGVGGCKGRGDMDSMLKGRLTGEGDGGFESGKGLREEGEDFEPGQRSEDGYEGLSVADREEFQKIEQHMYELYEENARLRKELRDVKGDALGMRNKLRFVQRILNDSVPGKDNQLGELVQLQLVGREAVDDGAKESLLGTVNELKGMLSLEKEGFQELSLYLHGGGGSECK